jgi:hypothetical protein
MNCIIPIDIISVLMMSNSNTLDVENKLMKDNVQSNESDVKEPAVKKHKTVEPVYKLTKYAPYKIISAEGKIFSIDPNVLINSFTFFSTLFESTNELQLQLQDIKDDTLSVVLSQACMWYSPSYNDARRMTYAPCWAKVVITAFKWDANRDFLIVLMKKMKDAIWNENSFKRDSSVWHLSSIYNKLPSCGGKYKTFLTEKFTECSNKKFPIEVPDGAGQMILDILQDVSQAKDECFDEYMTIIKEIDTLIKTKIPDCNVNGVNMNDVKEQIRNLYMNYLD